MSVLEKSPFVACLKTATNPEDVIAATWKALEGVRPAPTPEALAKWWPRCPTEALQKADLRLRALVAARLEDKEIDVEGGLPRPKMLVTSSSSVREIMALVPARGGDEDEPWTAYVAVDLLGLAQMWLTIHELGREKIPFPLGEILRAWMRRARHPSRRHLLVREELRPPGDTDPLLLARNPGLLALARATLEATEVDGEPFATSEPMGKRSYRVAVAEQGRLFPGPRNLDGRATAGAVLSTLADLSLTGDERSTLRSDIARVGRMAYALTGAVRLSHAEGAHFIGGRDTPANRRRWRLAVMMGSGIRLILPDWDWWDLLDVSRSGEDTFRVGPPEWWLRREGPMAHRFTGGLFRTPVFETDRTPWRNEILARMIDGIEGGLTWGTAAGKGHQGRIPDLLRPERPGGPGDEVFIPWWQALRLSGEFVAPDAKMSGALRQRWRRRIAMLQTAEYFARREKAAPAGDTVEVLEVRRGGRKRTPGLVVRASARFCAAYANAKQTRISAARLLGIRKGG